MIANDPGTSSLPTSLSATVFSGVLLVVSYAVVDVLVRTNRKRRLMGEAALHDGQAGYVRTLLSVLEPSVVAWTVVPIALLATLQAMVSQGLFTGGNSIDRLRAVTFAGIALLLVRNRLAELASACASRMDARSAAEKDADASDEDALRRLDGAGAVRFLRSNLRALHAGATVVILVAISILGALAIELPSNNAIKSLPARYFLLEVAIVLLVVVTAYFLSLGHGTGPAVVVVACLVIGIAEYFVILFRNSAITFSDLHALGTAAEVSSGYTFTLTDDVMVAATYAMVAYVLSGYLVPWAPARRDVPWWRRRSTTNLAAAAVACAATLALVLVPNYRTAFGVNISYWDSVGSYKQYGFLPSFVMGVREAQIRRPANYSESRAKRLEKSYAAKFDAQNNTDARKAAEQQFAQTKPTVIAVMNETFSDMSVFEDIKAAGYDGPQYLKYGLADSLQQGALDVSVRGGGTCNSEFEFLTGISMGFVPANVFPYQTYSLGRVDSLARQFKGLGYHTVALHPNLGTNWNRNMAYRELGFDRFLDIDSFPKDAPALHAGVRDSVTYDKVIDLVEKSDGPQFILDVTMQNHGGYNLRNTPADILTGYNVEGAGNNDDLNEYLSVIGASDEDLRAFVERLRTIGKPVVLVFFGDHQPGISPAYNDASYPGEAEPGHSARTYQTRYVIWANYDVAGRDQVAADATVSASNLGATLMNAIGAPLSRYQKAELFSTTVVPQISSLGYQAPDGTWHAMSDAQGAEEKDLADLRTMFYYEFGSRV